MRIERWVMAHTAAQRDSLSWNFTCQAAKSHVSPVGAFTAESRQKQDDLCKKKRKKRRDLQNNLEEIVHAVINNEAKCDAGNVVKSHPFVCLAF